MSDQAHKSPFDGLPMDADTLINELRKPGVIRDHKKEIAIGILAGIALTIVIKLVTGK
jgi:hypothetical protein